jgi:hypothetical protein
MVLKAIRVIGIPERTRPDRSTSGVTLVELLVAISLSVLVVGMGLALFKDVGLAARLGSGRLDAGFQAQTAFTTLSNNLMSGGGILRIAPNRLVILNRNNRRMDYGWEDSTLSLNGKPFPFRLASLQISPEGPGRPEAKDFAVLPVWDLDSLDGDRDGRIGFDEMDRDRNGELEREECRFIGRISVEMKIVFRDLPNVQTTTVHPRNRVPAVTGQESDDIDGFGGIPEP